MINWWALLSSMVASVVLGFIWYGPLFGKKWMALTGIQMPAEKPPFSTMVKPIVISLVGALFASFILSSGIETSDLKIGLLAGFFAWIGFIVPVHLNFVAWEGKPWALFAIQAGYWLVLLAIMGAIIAAFR
ncbi:MAG TPA: DUF1761 domain-containing protein [Candidatus Paceibacterota bacterium]|jgi:hypothetical protein